METIYKEIKRLTKLSNTNEDKRYLKLNEEVGELAEAILSCNKEIGCEYKDKTKNDIFEEICDVIVVAMSMATLQDDKNYTNMKSIINEKLIKWNSNILIKEGMRNDR